MAIHPSLGSVFVDQSGCFTFTSLVHDLIAFVMPGTERKLIHHGGELERSDKIDRIRLVIPAGITLLCFSDCFWYTIDPSLVLISRIGFITAGSPHALRCM